MYSFKRSYLAGLTAVLAVGITACADLLDPEDPGNLVPATVEEDATLPRIRIPGTILHSEAFGDPTDPMIMVLHGGPGADYRGLLPLQALAADGYYVVFWDQRGTGLSQRHDASVYTMDGYLEDLRLVLEHYTTVPGQPVVFIGHSWGAMYATWFINEYGDYGGRIRGAILSEPGAFTKEQLDHFVEGLFGSIRFLGEEANDAIWLYRFLSPAEHARADYMAMVSSHAITSEHNDPSKPLPTWRAGAVVNGKLLDLVDEGFDWTTHLQAYTRPVLFLRGDLNTVATLSHQQELASSYPDATIETISGVGHEMIWERPADYLIHTRAYLQRIGFVGGAS
ncbi:MAG: alpha/beta hydrolase [Gemmatimonadota bacterium]